MSAHAHVEADRAAARAGPARRPRIPVWAIVAVGGLITAAIGLHFGGATTSPADRAANLTTVFLGIFIEAVPFLLAGSLVSGLIEVFVDRSAIERLAPRQPVLAAVVGSMLGFAFPVCECGVVPVTRRLYAKGLPISVGIAFLLAAPVVNPVAIASTWAAFGWGPILFGRVGLSIVIAIIIGSLFALAGPDEVLRPEVIADVRAQRASAEAAVRRAAVDGTAAAPDIAVSTQAAMGPQPRPVAARLGDAAVLATGDFVDMGRYMVTGALIAASLQTLVPQSVLLTLGKGPVVSVVTLMALAFILSVCSTVDAFLALAFISAFSPAAVLAFLVFGPMVDIKSCLMFLGVFRRRAVVYLVLLPLMLTLATAVWLNLNVRFPLSW